MRYRRETFNSGRCVNPMLYFFQTSLNNLFLSSSENLNRYLSHCGIALNYYLWLTVTSQTHVVPLYVSTTLKLT